MIFIDSGAWIALLDQRDGFHRRARAFQGELARGVHGRLVTTDYVLDEAVTYLRQRGPGHLVREFRGILTASESVQVVWTTPDRFWTAWDTLLSRPDKRWSLTDCLSFVTMQALGIRLAFGFDSDFRQAGFELLPGSE
ncbi:protein containing PilT protein [mine drainage metagenome]|uniref:Protein containing PilT protein n=1 Tax=mine drainage metagenome TaxID=410659 RepID=T1A7S1_9ZZZZ|nr:type II toxin-antitoxin system VapC family toxin [Thermoplasmata archaeon]